MGKCVQKLIAVYEHGNPGPEPDCTLERTEARRVVRNGDARFINHGDAIRLVKGLKAPIVARSAEHKWRPDSEGVSQ